MNRKNIISTIILAVLMVIALCACGATPSETADNNATEPQDNSKAADFLIGNWICGEYDEDATPLFYSASFKEDNSVEIVNGIPNSDVFIAYDGTWNVVEIKGNTPVIELVVDCKNGDDVQENQHSTLKVEQTGDRIAFSYEEKTDTVGLVTDKAYDKGEWREEYKDSISLDGLPLNTILQIGYWYDFSPTGFGPYECQEHTFDANGNVNMRTMNYETDTAKYYSEYSAYYYDVDKSSDFMYMVTKAGMRTLNAQWYYDSEKDLLYTSYYNESTGKDETSYLVHYRYLPDISTIKHDSKLYK